MTQEEYIAWNVHQATISLQSGFPGQVDHGKYSGDEAATILSSPGAARKLSVTFEEGLCGRLHDSAETSRHPSRGLRSTQERPIERRTRCDRSMRGKLAELLRGNQLTSVTTAARDRTLKELGAAT